MEYPYHRYRVVFEVNRPSPKVRKLLKKLCEEVEKELGNNLRTVYAETMIRGGKASGSWRLYYDIR